MRKPILALLLCLAAAVPARAQEPAPTDWSQRTLQDVAAIDGAVRAVYAGMADPDHPEIAERWALVMRDARLRAAEVNSRAGWAGTLRILVNSLRDSHASLLIAAGQPPAPIRWTGYAVEHIAGQYFLRAVDAPGAPAGEMRILRCDGRPIDAVAAQLDLNVTNWWVPANRSLAAPRLLVDSGNPFLNRIGQCVVLVGGRERQIDFAWREAAARDISAAIRPYQRRRAGERRFALDWQADGSAWINVPSFSDSSGNAALRGALVTELGRLRGAPYIVIDVRGNGGGNSQIGTELSETLWGAGSVIPPPPVTRPKRWRASVQLVQALRNVPREQRDGASTYPERDRFIAAVLPAIVAGVERGLALVDDPVPAAAGAARRPRAGPAPTGPVFVLTDGGCASACILFVNEARRMGARQIGDPTDRNTIYAEQWYAGMLPSGEAQLMLPSAWFGWPESELGGGPPDIQWRGAASDEAGLRTFVAAQAAPAPR